MRDKQILLDAVALLNDENLVWDADFELIRHELATILRLETYREIISSELLEIAKILISTTKH